MWQVIMHKDEEGKIKFTIWEKTAVFIIVILVIIILLLIFNEKIKEYFEIFKYWYDQG